VTEEKILIEKCLQNNSKAQKKLFEHYSDKMFIVCKRYVTNATDAEDIMITAFFKAFSNLEAFEYREEGSFEKWLKTIMINHSLKHLRDKREIYTMDLSLAGSTLDDENTDYDFDSTKIYVAITELPPGYRTVFNLFVLDGYSHEEIADKLGISISTSKTQLFKARNILKSKIQKSQIYAY